MMDMGASYASLVELLRHRARTEGDRRAKTFLPTDGRRPVHRTYGELDRAARAIGRELAGAAAPGDRALLLYPPGLEFMEAFFGCLYAGLVAVPAPPPDPRRLDRTLPRLLSILDDSAPALVLTVEEALPALTAAGKSAPALSRVPWVATDALTRSEAPAGEGWQPFAARGETLAYLQYTSGSTSAPKGVRSTHAHILTNCRYLVEAFGYHRKSVQLSWVPDFHDDGLIQGVVLSVFAGFWSLRMAPFAIARRPLDWLAAISEHRVTHSGGPNFVYELAAERIPPTERGSLDLSCWKAAYNAAEPIRPSTLKKFQAAFGDCGFRWSSFAPAFGMAETTLVISAKPRGREPLLVPFDAKALELDGRAKEVAAGEGARVLVGCGAPIGEARFVIADPKTGRALPDGQVGELWISDPCVADGYWGRLDATAETFGATLEGGEGPFLRTGDLAFLHRGEVFIAGRLKDLIILDGRNLYPQDIEGVAEGAHPALRKGCTAAFSVDAEGKERLVVVQEARAGLGGETAAEARGAIRGAVAEALDAEVWQVVLIAPGTLAKTSSGKIQRRASRAAFLAGELTPLEAALPGTDQKEAEAPATDAPAAASVTAWMRRRLARHLGRQEAEIDPRQPFSHWGLGSTALVGLAGELEERLGRRLPETFLWQNPTIEAVAATLAPEPAGPPPGEGRRDGEGRLGARLSGERDPVAIVGIGCRFPGAAGPRAFWKLLEDGVDAVGEVPSSRWAVDDFYHPDPRTPGKMSTRWGGFLTGVEDFDPYFFGISPREAERMDPQQRLILEVAWEALEDAGIPPRALAGSTTGVWVGIGISDYGRWLFEDGALSDAYAGTGGALSIAANRLSYFLDLRGPSVAVDTACSASLVAVEQACRSLWRGETELALAGGVNLLLAPEVTVNFSQAGFLAPDGRSKAFDSRADGYVRSEGAGVVVLKPLSRARADGDPIYAVLLGGAVNQDGRSNGLTAPNPEAQERLVADACRDAGVAPAEIQAVEAHGTGTALGDPIEARALGAVLGQGRPADRPCSLGSVKTNLGHLETAAGIAGLIKTALSLHHRRRVPSLHFQEPNPRIDFDALGLAVQTEAELWESDGSPRRAGVSSFGFGGTNAHVILEEAPAPPVSPPSPGDREELVVLSAQDPQALRQRAADLLAVLPSPGAAEPRPDRELRDLSWTTTRRRSHLDHRLALVAKDLDEAREVLAAVAAGDELKDLAQGQRPFEGPAPIAFVFPGQGGQWPAMGQELYATEAVFREALEEAVEALRPHVDWEPLTELLTPGESSRLEEIDVVQPLLFALQVALAALWRSWGVEPAAVVGHSLGEVAAATVAGALSLKDGARIICHRSQLMRMTSGGGAMLAVALGEEALRGVIEPFDGRVEIAVVNGPKSLALSGEVEAIEALRASLEERGVFCRRVQVDVAAHGPQMEPLVELLGALLRDLEPEAARLPIFSTVSGEVIPGEELDAGYWQRNLRRPVRFAAAVGSALEAGITTFVEIGPHPLLVRPLGELGRASGQPVAAVGSLHREEGERRQMLRGLATLFCRGVEPRWEEIAPDAGRCLPLPAYPWQRQRYWLERSGAGRRRGAQAGTHPLLGRRLDSARRRESLWQGRLERGALDFLDSHRLKGVRVLPGTAYLEMAAAAGGGAVRDVHLRQPLWIEDEAWEKGEIEVQTVVFDGGFEIYARRGGGPWTLHAEGELALGDSPPEAASDSENLDPEAVKSRMGKALEAGAFYRRLADRGYTYGPAHRRLARLWAGDGEALAELREPPVAAGSFLLHPAVLDAAWQALGSLLPAPEDGEGSTPGSPWLPARVGSFEVSRTEGRPAVWVRARVDGIDGDRIRAGVDLFDREGAPVARTRGLELRRGVLEPPVPASARNPGIYHLVWKPQELRETAQRAAQEKEGRSWLVLADGQGVGEALAEKLRQRGDHVVLLSSDLAGDAGAALAEASPPVRRVVDLRPVDATRTAEEAAAGTLSTIQHLARRPGSPTPLTLVTRGGVRLAPEGAAAPSSPETAQAPVRGLAAVLAHERPELFGGLVDLDPEATAEDSAAALLHELASSLVRGSGEAPEEGVALRKGARFVPRLVTSEAARDGEGLWAGIREDRGYLVTGGFGGLGLTVARRLAARGARQLALLGRREPAEGSEAQRTVAELEAGGCTVYPLIADVTDEEALGAALDAYPGPPWAGVVHGAGVVADASLPETTGEALAAVLAPKVSGSWNLHRRFAEEDLDFFLLFSSAAAVLGNPGQGAYAAANAFLGALAEHRRSLGLPALTVHWGPWAEVGFVARQEESLHRRLEAQGFFPMDPEAALDALDAATGGSREGPAQVTVLAADWARLEVSGGPLAGSPLLAELAPAERLPRNGNGPAASPGGDLSPGFDLDGLRRAEDPAERRSRLEAYLRRRLAKVLKIPTQRLEAELPLTAHGLDSLVAVEVRSALERDLELEVPLAWLLQGESLTGLRDRLLGELPAGGPEVSAPPAPLPNLEDLSPEQAEALLKSLDDLPASEIEDLLARIAPLEIGG